MLPSTDLSHWLKTTSIFRELNSAQLRSLADIAQLQTFPKGDYIFHQGSAATGFFVVKIGRVKVFKLSTQGKEQILHFFGPGDHFAEVPALDGQDFPASAATLEPSEVIFLPRVAFIQLLHQYPDIANAMLISLSQHARHLGQLVEDLSFKEVPERLATYLLNLSDRVASTAPNHTSTPCIVELDLSKSQLAAALGTIPATLSRAFDRLSREGMIVIRGTRIELRDRDRLQDLSQSLRQKDAVGHLD